MKRTIALLFFLYPVVTLGLSPNEFESEGRICHFSGGIQHKSIKCRQADSISELEEAKIRTVQRNQFHKNLEGCEFSSFRSWNSELKRISESLAVFERLAERSNNAKSDLGKSAYLSSDAIASAKRKLEMHEKLQKFHYEKIDNLSWCQQYASKRVK
jgi:hypothetical protein